MKSLFCFEETEPQQRTKRAPTPLGLKWLLQIPSLLAWASKGRSQEAEKEDLDLCLRMPWAPMLAKQE